MRYIVQVDPPIALELWNPQYPGDLPHWHFSVEARSREAALETMRHSECPDMPMRVVHAAPSSV